MLLFVLEFIRSPLQCSFTAALERIMQTDDLAVIIDSM